MKKTVIVSGMLAGGLMLAPVAQGATAYTNGIFGIGPQWSTITGPNGEKCNCGFLRPGERIVPRNNLSVQSYEAAIITWLEDHQDEDNVGWGYSESAQAWINVAEKRPDLMQRTTVINLAPPKAGSIGYNQIDPPNNVNMYQIIVKGDSVADEAGTSLEKHRTGYNNLNMQTQQPVSSTVLEGTNTKRNYYEAPVRTNWLANLFKPKTEVQKLESGLSPNTKKMVTETSETMSQGSLLTTKSSQSDSPKKTEAGRVSMKQKLSESREARQVAREERKAKRENQRTNNEHNESNQRGTERSAGDSGGDAGDS